MTFMKRFNLARRACILCLSLLGPLTFIASGTAAANTTTNIYTNSYTANDTANDTAPQNITVSHIEDNGAGTLRDAVNRASSGDTIDFDAVLTGQTITLVSPIVLSKDLTINGTVPVTISGNNTTRIFQLIAGAKVVMNNLTIQDGQINGNGGGISLNSGTALTLNNSIVSGNSATNAGGGIYSYGSVLTLRNSIVRDNVASSFGGGIYSNQAATTVTVENSVIVGNKARFGGGIYNISAATVDVRNSTIRDNSSIGGSGGGIYNSGAATINVHNSTIHNNSSDEDGGGLYNATSGNGELTVNDSTINDNFASNDGGGFYNSGTGLTVSNSTISGNSASNTGGGLFNNDMQVLLNHTTIAKNSALDGSGIGSFGDFRATTILKNSIIAGNSGGSDIALVGGTEDSFVENGHNLIGTVGANISTVASDSDAASDIDVLADNGCISLHTTLAGLACVQTHALLPGSNAIAAATTSTTAIDQRGILRPQGLYADSGSYESPYIFPVAVDDPDVMVTEDSSVIIAPLANDTDVNLDPLSLSSLGIPANGTATISGNQAIYTPALNFNGVDTFSYIASDGFLTSTATITVTINAVNDAPIAIDDPNEVTSEDLPAIISLLNNDIDIDGDLLSISNLSTPAHGTVAISGTQVIYTPAPNFSGVDPFTYVVSDGLLTDTATIIVTVDSVNDSPTAVDDPDEATTEDSPLTISPLGNDSDVDSNSLHISNIDEPANGIAVIVGDQILYTPTLNFNGVDLLTYTVSDGFLTDRATISVTVAAQNDAPISMPDTANTSEDTSVTIDPLTNDSDVDNALLSIRTVGTPANGTVTLSGKQVIYTPALNFNGTDFFTYLVTDGFLTDTATISVTVDSVNDAPMAVDDPDEVTDEDRPLTISPLRNDSDVDSNPLHISNLDQPANGTAVIIGEQILYTPTLNFNGADLLTYTVSDGFLTDMATISVTVNTLNDAPVSMPDVANTSEDTPVVIDPLTNDSDVDSALLNIHSIGTPANGTAVLSGSQITYTPSPNFNGTDSFTYVVTDGFLTDMATISVTVAAVNNAPVALDNAYAVPYAAPFHMNAPGLLDNDEDVDLDTLSAILLDGPTKGTLALAVDGSFVYTPTRGMTGTDTFTYMANDGSVNANVDVNVATVELTIGAIPTYTLSFNTITDGGDVGSSGVGTGNVILSPPGGVYPDQTLVTLTAVANADTLFNQWSGDLNTPIATTTILIDGNKAVTANFNPISRGSYTFSVSVVGKGSVLHNGSELPSSSYEHGTTVSLTAVPDPDWRFDGWSGDLNTVDMSSVDDTTTLIMEGDKTLTALFTRQAWRIFLPTIQN